MTPSRKIQKKADVLKFIRTYHEKYKIAPTIREIAAAFNHSDNPGNTQRLLKELKTEGWIDFQPSRARTVIVVKEGDYYAAGGSQ